MIKTPEIVPPDVRIECDPMALPELAARCWMFDVRLYRPEEREFSERGYGVHKLAAVPTRPRQATVDDLLPLIDTSTGHPMRLVRMTDDPAIDQLLEEARLMRHLVRNPINFRPSSPIPGLTNLAILGRNELALTSTQQPTDHRFVALHFDRERKESDRERLHFLDNLGDDPRFALFLLGITRKSLGDPGPEDLNNTLYDTLSDIEERGWLHLLSILGVKLCPGEGLAGQRYSEDPHDGLTIGSLLGSVAMRGHVTDMSALPFPSVLSGRNAA